MDKDDIKFIDILNAKIFEDILEEFLNQIDSRIQNIARQNSCNIINDKNTFCLLVLDKNVLIRKFNYQPQIQELQDEFASTSRFFSRDNREDKSFGDRSLTNRLAERADSYLRGVARDIQEEKERKLGETQDVTREESEDQRLGGKNQVFYGGVNAGFILQRRRSIEDQGRLAQGSRPAQTGELLQKILSTIPSNTNSTTNTTSLNTFNQSHNPHSKDNDEDVSSSQNKSTSSNDEETLKGSLIQLNPQEVDATQDSSLNSIHQESNNPQTSNEYSNPLKNKQKHKRNKR